jgi:hypothetical protein
MGLLMIEDTCILSILPSCPKSRRCHFPYMIHYTWQACGKIVLEDIKNTNKVMSSVSFIRRRRSSFMSKHLGTAKWMVSINFQVLEYRGHGTTWHEHLFKGSTWLLKYAPLKALMKLMCITNQFEWKIQGFIISQQQQQLHNLF